MLTRRSIPLSRPVVLPVAAAALRNDRMLLLDRDGLVTVALDDAGTVNSSLRYQGEPPLAITLSPSGRCAAACFPDRILLFNAATGEELRELPALSTLKFTPIAGMLSAGRDEVLIATQERCILDCYRLEDMSKIVRVDCRKCAFGFTDCVPMNDGESFVVFGYLFGEGNDSLAIYSLRDLEARADGGLVQDSPLKVPINDYSSRLAAGPYGSDSVVVFRDPETEEWELEDETISAEEFQPDGFYYSGVYIKRLADAALLDHFALSSPVKALDGVFGQPGVVVLKCPDRVEIVRLDRRPVQVRPIPCLACAFDPERRRFALVGSAESVDLYELPR